VESREFLIPALKIQVGMVFQDIKRRLPNRYYLLLLLLVFMLYIHVSIIPIHPLIFLVWPLSLWLLIEILVEFRKNRYKLLIFVATFTGFLYVTQILVVTRLQGIFFALDPVPNMSTITDFVLVEAIVMFLFEIMVFRSISFRDVPSYIGFASVIPWLSPAIIEALVLTQWSSLGILPFMISGKGIGGASLNDILFYYGGRNFVVSSTLFYASVLVLYVSQRMIQQREENKLKRLFEEKDKEWLIGVWEDPLTLLSVDERETFLIDFGHLGKDEQNKALRNEILPAKGIFLIDPQTFN